MDGEHVLTRDLQRAVRWLVHVEIDVRLVADEEESMLLRQRGELFVMLARRTRARGILRIVVEDDRRAPPIRRGHRIQVRQETAVRGERQRARHPPGEEDRPLVDGVGRIRVPAERPGWIEHRERKVEERLLRSLARNDFAIRVHRQPEAPLQVARDRLSQLRNAPDGRILGDVRHSVLERLADERGSRLARIADAEVVDGTAALERGLPLRVGLFLQIPGEPVEQRVERWLHPAFTTGFRRTPTPSTSISTVSPAWMGPTPSGVPVVTTSPGSSVIPAEMKERRRGTGKI